MLRTLTFSLCYFIIISFMDNSYAKRQIKAMSGFAKMTAKQSKHETSQVVELKIEHNVKNVELKKCILPVTSSKGLVNEFEDVTTLTSADQSVFCIEKRSAEGAQVTRCMEETENGYTYYKEDKALVTENDETTYDDVRHYGKKLVGTTKSKTEIQERLRRSKRHKFLTPNFNTKIGTIKIKFVPTASFMKIFQDFVNGNTTDAKNEVTLFLTLISNRVRSHDLHKILKEEEKRKCLTLFSFFGDKEALLFMSVKEWGLTFTTSNNVSYPLDYTVYMESISFPPVNETRDTFVTIEPLQRHIDEDGNLNADLYFDEAGNFLGVLGLELDFPRYVKQEYGASTSFNHLHLVTGDNIVDNYYTWFENGTVELIGRYPGVIGIAGGIGALCENYEMSEYDFRVSFNEFYSAAFVNLLAHELGHNAGSWHDTSTRCPASDSYIMAPSLSPKLTTISSNYYKFSLCSAEYFASYLSRFTSEEIASCIYTEHPTKEEFLSTFCRGIEGFTYTPDAHCKLFFGANSYVCTEGSDLLANGYVHGKSCETYIEDLSFVPIFRCAMNNDCIDTPNKITHVFDGTKCSNNKPKGKKVCYEGKCQSKIKICKNKQQTSKKKSSGKLSGSSSNKSKKSDKSK